MTDIFKLEMLLLNPRLVPPPPQPLLWSHETLTVCSTALKDERSHLLLQVPHAAQVQPDSFDQGYEDDDSDHNEFVVIRQD